MHRPALEHEIVAKPALPGDIYTVAGADSAFNSPDGVAVDATGNVYVADATNNRVQEIAATTHSQWGMSMTAGDTYTIAGTGTAGHAGDGGAATSAQLSCPSRLALDAAGDLYIADYANNRVQEVAAATGTQWGTSMTANDIYTIAGSSSGTSGHTGDGGAATSALLSDPAGVGLDSAGDLYIADYANNRAQEVPVSTGTQWGTSMTANDIYTVAGSSSGTSGHSGDNGAATSALLHSPNAVTLDSSGDLYIADGANNRVQEVAAATGAQWGLAMTADDIYPVVSGSTGCAGAALASVAACLSNPAALAFDSAGDLFIADDTNNTIREVVGPLATRYTYDAYGDLTSTTDPDGDVTSATYDDLGNQLSTTDARGYTTSYAYDADNELTGVTLPSTGTESYTYDGDGNKLTFVDARAKTTTYTYDALDRLSSVEDSNSHTTSYTYDPAGNKLSMTDADTDTTSYAYNADNELVTVTQPTTTTLSYTYDADGNQASYTNAAGNETTYAYNYLDELTSATDADGHVTSYTYDADGNQLTLTKPDTKVTTSSYNADDELTGVSYSDGTTHSVSYGYDPDGNVASMTDATGTSLYAYDPADRLAMYQNGAGATVTYSYEPDGDITDIAYPGGDTVTKAYDDMDRLSSLTDWLGGTTSYSYDADSDPTGLAYPNGVSSATTYDNADQLASITDTKGATTLVSFSYSRDNYGDLSSETDTGTPGAGTTSYTYTSLHQVSAAGSASYGYDAANDLTTSPAGATQAFDPAGELCWAGTGSAACTSPPSGTTTYSYSADGNRTATTPSSGPSTSYSWDQANDLTNVTTGSSSATYTYDGNGLRQSKTTGSTTTNYSWDVEGSLALLLSDGTNNYIYGLGGTPVEQVSSSGIPTYLLTDQLGSTRALTNSSGTVTATFTYDAWGNLAGSTGSATTPFMYAGQYLDSTTGLYYMQARWYEPATGQFLSVDPLVDATQQPFSYGGNDPVNSLDPSGLADILKCSGTANAVMTGNSHIYAAEAPPTTPVALPVPPTTVSGSQTIALAGATITISASATIQQPHSGLGMTIDASNGDVNVSIDGKLQGTVSPSGGISDLSVTPNELGPTFGLDGSIEQDWSTTIDGRGIFTGTQITVDVSIKIEPNDQKPGSADGEDISLALAGAGLFIVGGEAAAAAEVFVGASESLLNLIFGGGGAGPAVAK